jgi:hypothetical protein
MPGNLTDGQAGSRWPDRQAEVYDRQMDCKLDMKAHADSKQAVCQKGSGSWSDRGGIVGQTGAR